MNRLAPNVPQLNTGDPITAADWNRFVYSAGFHLRAPSALLAQTVSQAVASSTATRLAFDQAVRDTEGGHDPSTNSSRYTVKTAGTYLVSSFAFMQGFTPAGGEESIAIIVNEAVIWAIQLLPRDSGITNPMFSCTAEIPLQLGDYIETQLWQDSGTAQSTSPSVLNYCWMGLHWVGV
jgi:hypothetical protein